MYITKNNIVLHFSFLSLYVEKWKQPLLIFIKHKPLISGFATPVYFEYILVGTSPFSIHSSNKNSMYLESSSTTEQYNFYSNANFIILKRGSVVKIDEIFIS